MPAVPRTVRSVYSANLTSLCSSLSPTSEKDGNPWLSACFAFRRPQVPFLASPAKGSLEAIWSYMLCLLDRRQWFIRGLVSWYHKSTIFFKQGTINDIPLCCFYRERSCRNVSLWYITFLKGSVILAIHPLHLLIGQNDYQVHLHLLLFPVQPH